MSSSMRTRADVVAALTTVADVRGYEFRPSATNVGDAWPLMGHHERDEGDAFRVTWRVQILAPQDERAAAAWWDSHWPHLFHALEPVGSVTGADPITLSTNAGDQLAYEITFEAED